MKFSIRRAVLIPIGIAIVAASCARSSSEYLERGRKQLSEGKAHEASLSFRLAVQADPKSGEAYKALGQASFEKGEIGDALQAYSSAAELLPDDVDLLERLANVILGAYLANPQRPTDLKERLQSLATSIERLDSRSPEAWRIRGIVAGAAGSHEEALAHFRTATAIPPLKPGLVLLELQALLNTGHVAEAEQGANQLIKDKPDFGPAYDWLFDFHIRRGDSQEAEQVLLRKIDANPENIAFRLQLARFYSQSGRPDSVEDVVSRSLERMPDGGSMLALGEFYLSVGDFDKALVYYQQGAKADSPAVRQQALNRVATVLGAQGKLKEALVVVTKARKADNDDIAAVRLEAELRARTGAPEDLDIAIQIFRELLIRSATDMGARYGLAVALLARGETSLAQEELMRCIGINPNHRAAPALLADMYRSRGDFRNLRMLGEAILNSAVNEATGKLLRAEGLIGERRTSEARTALAPLVDEPETAVAASLLVAKSWFAEKNYPVAEQALRNLAAKAPGDLRVVGPLSDVLAAQGRTTELTALWKAEMARSPQSVAVQLGFAKALFADRQYDQVIAVCRGLTAASSDNLEATVLLATALYVKGRKDEALPLLQHASNIEGANRTYVDAVIATLYQEDSEGVAELHYRRILSREPDNHTVLNNLAYLLAEQGPSIQEAATMASRALALQEKNVDYQDTVAFVSIQAGEADRAESMLSTLVSREPRNPSYWFHYGLALAQLGRNDDARRAFTTALSLDPPPALAARIRGALQDR